MRWSEMSTRRRGALVVPGCAEIALTSAVAVDLAFRPQDDVRGRKALWWAGIFVQPVGPIAYLLWGRRRPRS
ncbi:PLDc_N domain-containing protein [Nonomuraea terrae]|uniref:PLDc_N domain-containing protein n=1 Tax=Nonomuraea terrae TaxID=2530383 RepID=A0A4R4YMR4_9ACTN|nr:PLD nuclease N-terminal domain-containing protein [Nonomuraea terrae]TDD46348.1 PLDc_N domain-containing protein [Nonomuraea terrae]